MWKYNREGSAFSGGRSNGNMSVVNLYNLFADRQTKAVAADLEGILSAVKGLEYFIDLVGRNTDAGISYLNQDIFCKKVDGYMRGIIFRKFTRVIDQVQEKYF